MIRGVWAAELHNLNDMRDFAYILLGFMQEVKDGRLTPEQLRDRANMGSFSMDAEVFTDSYSIFSAVVKEHAKSPTDGSTLYHLLTLHRDEHEGAVKKFTWVDTRDMVVDGLTKGSVDRVALQQAMRGTWTFLAECNTFTQPIRQILNHT